MKQTPLFELVKMHGGKIVDFAGFKMPVQFTSVIEEHLWTRSNASLFDVSHMGRIMVSGKDDLAFLNFVSTINPHKLPPFSAQYSFILNDNGGIKDDVIVYNLQTDYLVVVNAVNREKILNHLHLIKEKFGFEVTIKDLSEEISQIALQGPRSWDVLQPLVKDDLIFLKNYHCVWTSIKGVKVLVSRTGYTGEFGYEIYTDSNSIIQITEMILENPLVKFAGLGARDTLRLEMGYPLWGNDIDENITPVEAGLTRFVFMDKDFIGKEALENKLREGVDFVRKGFLGSDKSIIPRKSWKVCLNDKEVGFVTSGNYSPSLGVPIAMGYITKRILENKVERVILTHGDRKGEFTLVGFPFLKRS